MELYSDSTAGILVAAAAAGIAAGDHVEVINAGTTVIVDGTTGSTTQTTRSIGIAKTATATGAIDLVVLPSRTIEIAAT